MGPLTELSEQLFCDAHAATSARGEDTVSRLRLAVAALRLAHSLFETSHDHFELRRLWRSVYLRPRAVQWAHTVASSLLTPSADLLSLVVAQSGSCAAAGRLMREGCAAASHHLVHAPPAFTLAIVCFSSAAIVASLGPTIARSALALHPFQLDLVPPQLVSRPVRCTWRHSSVRSVRRPNGRGSRCATFGPRPGHTCSRTLIRSRMETISALRRP